MLLAFFAIILLPSSLPSPFQGPLGFFCFFYKKRLIQSLNLFVFVLFTLKDLNDLSFGCDLMTKPGFIDFKCPSPFS